MQKHKNFSQCFVFTSITFVLLIQVATTCQLLTYPSRSCKRKYVTFWRSPIPNPSIRGMLISISQQLSPFFSYYILFHLTGKCSRCLVYNKQSFVCFGRVDPNTIFINWIIIKHRKYQLLNNNINNIFCGEMKREIVDSHTFLSTSNSTNDQPLVENTIHLNELCANQKTASSTLLPKTIISGVFLTSLH